MDAILIWVILGCLAYLVGFGSVIILIAQVMGHLNRLDCKLNEIRHPAEVKERDRASR